MVKFFIRNEFKIWGTRYQFLAKLGHIPRFLKKEKMRCYAEDVIPLKGALEKWYFQQRSFWVDLKIIVATALAIVAPGARFYLGWFDVEGLVRRSTLCAYFVSGK